MNENNFKAFDKVLVRNNRTDKWHCDLYCYAIKENVCGNYNACIGGNFVQCIPYEGNEELLGTTDEPKPKRWRAERGGHYWYVDYDGTATEIYESFDYFDEKRYSIGNYFRTFEEAEEMAVKFRALLVKAMMKGE